MRQRPQIAVAPFSHGAVKMNRTVTFSLKKVINCLFAWWPFLKKLLKPES